MKYISCVCVLNCFLLYILMSSPIGWEATFKIFADFKPLFQVMSICNVYMYVYLYVF